MRTYPRMSVIIPVYNCEKYIRETIESVILTSKNADVEIIVVDDGSTDSTPHILKGYYDSIKIVNQPNSGESSAVNTGFANAVGDFVLVVSADDPLLTSDIFKGVPEYFDSNPTTVAWYPDWLMINEVGLPIKSIRVGDYSDEKLIGKFLCLPGPGAFIRKFSALEIGGRRVCWQYVGDYDFWLRLSRVGSLVRRPGELAQWRCHDGSSSISMRGTRMFHERIQVITDFVGENSLPSPLKRMALGNAYYSAALLKFFDPKLQGRRALLKAFYHRRGIPENLNYLEFFYLIGFPVSKYFYFLGLKFKKQTKLGDED